MEDLKNVHSQLSNLRGLTKKYGRDSDDPKGQALCETTSEVLAGLEKAFDHYLNKSEKAWE